MQEPVGLLKTGSETAEADGHDGDLPELFKITIVPIGGSVLACLGVRVATSSFARSKAASLF